PFASPGRGGGAAKKRQRAFRTGTRLPLQTMPAQQPNIQAPVIPSVVEESPGEAAARRADQGYVTASLSLRCALGPPAEPAGREAGASPRVSPLRGEKRSDPSLALRMTGS